ncbi:efflux RND transporter periplasmic adaptor subunit [Pseudoflavitalea sp. G-6-1-2]|uniref:efflux RND transporter periplasmic adaptor subunit n=1 Tax=Pseudoflavitalea sp. G-6-1-2 TaxID=2728841 RepID=UPI00197D83B0|nr:efflux RND transporter periplasmic adaptor subunit [Pseudoflavitalea sp. G-6-1-2]
MTINNNIINLFKAGAFAAALFSMEACGDSNSKAVEKEAGAKEAGQEGHHEEGKGEVELTPDQARSIGVETGNVSVRTLSGTIKVNGTLDVPPQQMLSVSAPMGGFLRSSEMLQGKYVRKGELIATLEDPAYLQLQQDYLESASQLDFLKAEFERQEELLKENINAKKTFEQAKANYRSMQAKLAGLKAKLQLAKIDMSRLSKGEIQPTINIHAPISGYVTEVNVNLGKYVNPTDVMFEIVDTEHLHAELTVFEKDVPKLKIGQKVRFILANELKERMATVYLIGREISADRTVRIHCHLDKEDRELLPGMYLTAFVETKNEQLPSVPETAVVNYEGKNYIFIKEEEAGHDDPKKEAGAPHLHYKAVEVQTGVSELGYVAIQLPQGFDVKATPIVFKGAYDLLSKWKNSGEEGHDH